MYLWTWLLVPIHQFPILKKNNNNKCSNPPTCMISTLVRGCFLATCSGNTKWQQKDHWEAARKAQKFKSCQHSLAHVYTESWFEMNAPVTNVWFMVCPTVTYLYCCKRRWHIGVLISSLTIWLLCDASIIFKAFVVVSNGIAGLSVNYLTQ